MFDLLFDWLKGRSSFDIICLILAIVGVVVGIIGLWFAYRQYRDQQQTEQSLDDATRKLDELNARLVTADERLVELQDKTLTIAVARFPLNLEEIIAFIGRSQTELAIMCDFVGYAMYSNTLHYPRYLEALTDARARGVTIRLLLYGLDTARQAVGNQLPPARYLQIRESELCVTYFKRNHGGKACPDSYNEFRDTLLRDEEKLVNKLGDIELKVIDHNLLAFAWIADQAKSCIFSFRNGANNESGMTFRTQDTYIAADFQTVFLSEWEKASHPLYKERW
jgi:hypothetical protein